MSKELTIRELESWIPLLEMFSDKHSVLQGAAGEDAMNVGDVLEIIRSHITCRAVTDLCCRNQAARPEVVQQGSWPADDLRRAFVAGARWWEYASDSATMWPADVRRAEEEAEKRYTPSPRGKQ